MFIRILIITLFFVTACTPKPNPVQTSAPTQVTVQETLQKATEEPSQATPVPSPGAEDGSQEELTQIVIKDLSERLHMNTEGIKIISTEALVWPNAALGCPLPGKVYVRGTVPGFRIRLEADSKEYSYHTDRTGQFTLCAAPNTDSQNRPKIPVPTGEIDDGQPWVPVD